jgi:glycerol uptake facilitator-like aquaporin
VAFYDWLLALHLLAAGALVAALVLYSVVIASGWNLALPSEVSRLFRLARAGDAAIAVGSIGTLVLGIWLAIDSDDYQVWDGWVIAAIVLWALAIETGRRTGTVYNAARDRARALVAEGRDTPVPELGALVRSTKGLAFHTATVVLILALLVDMIYKPGA